MTKANWMESKIGATTLCYSYSTLVGVATPSTVYVTNRKYSVTTSRHVNLFLRRHAYGKGLPIVSVSPDRLLPIAHGDRGALDEAHGQASNGDTYSRDYDGAPG